MKVFKNRVGLKLVFIMLLVVVMSPNIVNAKKQASSTACSNALFGSGGTITYSAGATSYSVNISVNEGTWDVYYRIGKEDDDYTNVIGDEGLKNVHGTTYKAGDATPSDISSISREDNSNKEVFIFMVLRAKENNHGMNKDGELLEVESNGKKTTCVAGSKKSFSISNNAVTFKSVNGKKPTVIVRRFTVPAKLKKTSITKSSNAECQKMQAGKYNSNDSSSTYDLSGENVSEYNEKMKSIFPYCYSGVESSFDIDDKTIRAVRKKSLKAFKEYLNFKKAQKDNSKFDAAAAEISSGNYKKVSYTNNQTLVNQLSCDKKIDTETTKKYYTSSVVEDNSICKVTCQEQFQVTYDPPVAVKAGLCFQYKVTVRSKVTCKTESKGNIPWPTPPETCGYVPICEDNEEETQAGPNDDFDSCINSCDGGKYTQSCINSCYKEVYKNKDNTSSTKKTSVETNIKVKTNSTVKLKTTNDDPYYKVNGCKTASQIRGHLSECAKKFYELKQKYPMGYYVPSTDDDEKWIDYRWKICWKSNDSKKCEYTSDDNDDDTLNFWVKKWVKSTTINDVIEHIKRASPYYFRDLGESLRTIKSFFGEGTGNNGKGAKRYYQIDNRGIKRQWSNSYACHETCGYISDGGNAGSCLTSSDEVKKHYTEKLENIESKLAKCSAEATCKEDTSTFYIDVNDKKTYSDKSKQSWKATNRSSSKSSTPQTGGDTGMFIPLKCTDEQKQATPLLCDVETSEQAPGINGICYGRDNKSYWQHYKTTITFPGTWINLKSAERVYSRPNSTELNKYREKENYYCTGYDSEDVNKSWWQWKVNGKGNIDSITLEKDNNISAKIVDFGKFNWQVSLKCFFGLSTEICPCGTEGCDKCEKEVNKCSDNNSTALCNYIFRPVDQSNMFPDKSGVGSRDRGFNWTSAAKDNTVPNNSSYNIDPEKYWQELESSADDAFPKSDGDFSKSDYRIQLTTDNIKNIKAYVKNNNFNTFSGTYNKVTPEVDGLYYYRSNLRNNKSLVESWQGDLAGKNNN